jgi:hypothetical protein
MKTKDFIIQVRNLGFEVEDFCRKICIFDREITDDEKYYEDDNYAVAVIERDIYKDFLIEGNLFDENTSFEIISKLLRLIAEYTTTPVSEREDEKKYYLRHKLLYGGSVNYLNFDNSTELWKLNNKSQNEYTQTQFTQEEIDGIKKGYNVDLKDFEIIEV